MSACAGFMRSLLASQRMQKVGECRTMQTIASKMTRDSQKWWFLPPFRPSTALHPRTSCYLTQTASKGSDRHANITIVWVLPCLTGSWVCQTWTTTAPTFLIRSVFSTWQVSKWLFLEVIHKSEVEKTSELAVRISAVNILWNLWICEELCRSVWHYYLSVYDTTTSRCMTLLPLGARKMSFFYTHIPFKTSSLNIWISTTMCIKTIYKKWD